VRQAVGDRLAPSLDAEAQDGDANDVGAKREDDASPTTASLRARPARISAARTTAPRPSVTKNQS